MNCPYCQTYLGEARSPQCQSCSGTPKFYFPSFVAFYFEYNGKTLRIIYSFTADATGISIDGRSNDLIIMDSRIYCIEDAQAIFDRFIKLVPFS